MVTSEKASDGFGPIGNTIVRGIDYNKVQLTTVLTEGCATRKYLVHDPQARKVVSFHLSHYFTLF